MTSALRDQWIRYVFDRPVTDPAWHFSLDSPYWDLAPEAAAELIAESFENAGVLLQPFSDAQLNQAFWFLLSSGNSNYMFCLTDASVTWAARKRALRSFVRLFRDVMAVRCAPCLSHLDEAGATALNSACYMWWDLIPIGTGDPSDSALHDEVLAVLAEILDIPHDACRESALHGLGHWARYQSGVSGTIDRFLEGSKNLRPELVTYAKQARTGCVL
jgi:hypothetical protein